MDTNNVVVLLGRMAADPELRYLPNGTPVVNFAVAVNRTTRKPDGKFEDSLDGFFDCELFGGTAVTTAETFAKGSEVYLVGSLKQKKFKGSGGQNVSKIEIRVKTVGPVLPAAKDDGKQAAQPAEVAQPA
jgi:single-strand DNA-binding protein